MCAGASQAAQGLRLHDSTAEGAGLIPGQGTKTPHVMQGGQNNNTKIKYMSAHVCSLWPGYHPPENGHVAAAAVSH